MVFWTIRVGLASVNRSRVDKFAPRLLNNISRCDVVDFHLAKVLHFRLARLKHQLWFQYRHVIIIVARLAYNNDIELQHEILHDVIMCDVVHLLFCLYSGQLGPRNLFCSSIPTHSSLLRSPAFRSSFLAAKDSFLFFFCLGERVYEPFHIFLILAHPRSSLF